MESAGSDAGLTAIEILEYLPTAVALCSTKDLLTAVRVYVWGAKAICKVVNEAWVGGSDPFEPGGVFDASVLYALYELNRIRKQHKSKFSGLCPGLDLVFNYFVDQARLQQLSTKSVEELPSPSTPAPTATPISTPSTSATNGIAGGVADGGFHPRTAAAAVIGEDVEDDEEILDEQVVDATEGDSLFDDDDSTTTYDESDIEDIDGLPDNIPKNDKYDGADAKPTGRCPLVFSDRSSTSPPASTMSSATAAQPLGASLDCKPAGEEEGPPCELPFLSDEDPAEDHQQKQGEYGDITARHPQPTRTTGPVLHRNPLVWRRRPPKTFDEEGGVHGRAVGDIEGLACEMVYLSARNSSFHQRQEHHEHSTADHAQPLRTPGSRYHNPLLLIVWRRSPSNSMPTVSVVRTTRQPNIRIVFAGNTTRGH